MRAAIIHRRYCIKFKRHRPVTRSEITGDRNDPAQKRQPAGEGQVFTEHDEVLLVIRRHDLALAVEKKRRIERVVVVVTGRAGTRLGIVGAEDHPHLVRHDEVGDGAKIVFGKIGH